MKTQILYVLVSDSDDFYAEQLYISLVSLRKNAPGAVATVLTDQTTHEALSNRGKMGKRLLEIADNWVVASLDPTAAKEYRSRLLKTGMRQYIEGDFLFIDTDTMIAKPLDGIDDVPNELALCPDHHCRLQDNPEKDAIKSRCLKIGEDLSRSDFYFNSGVILARDTASVRDFFTAWQKNYLKGRENGVKTDQQSLAKTLNSQTINVGQLDGGWNCQLPYGVRYMGSAVVFHYFAGNAANSGEQLYFLNDTNVLARTRTSEELPSDVAAVIEDFFKGIPEVSLLIGGKDLDFRTTRRYKDLKRRFVPGKFSFLEFLLKIRARLPFTQ